MRSLLILFITLVLTNLNTHLLYAQDWEIGLFNEMIQVEASSYSSSNGLGFANDQILRPIGLSAKKRLSTNYKLELFGSTATRELSFFDEPFYTQVPLNATNELKRDYKRRLFFGGVRLHYKVAEYNGFSLSPVVGLSMLYQREHTTFVEGLYSANNNDGEIARLSFSETLLNEANPFVDVGLNLSVPLSKRLQLSISYLYSKPVFGAYYIQTFNSAHGTGTLDATSRGASFTEQPVLDSANIKEKFDLSTLRYSIFIKL